MAFRKVAKLIQELKLSQYNIYDENDKRKKRAFALTGFYLKEDIYNCSTLINIDTRFVSSIRLFKKCSDKTALILLNMDVILPKLIALKFKDSEFHFKFKEESYLIGLLVDQSIIKFNKVE